MWDNIGFGTVFKHSNQYCCPNDGRIALLDCHWAGKVDYADNTCGGSEVTLLTDERGNSYGGCIWCRQRTLCCTSNTEAYQTESCDVDLCDLNQTACDNDDVGEIKAHLNHLEVRAALPGQPRPKTIQLAKLLGTAIYKGKELTLTSRPYWPGLKSLKGDGSETLVIKGGYSLLKDACSSTALKFIPAASLPTKGFQMEHLREINMIEKFVHSLLTGIKYSGDSMTNTFDPLAIVAGWNKAYDVTLPRIGFIVKDAPLFTEPLTPNDRFFETIGSYAYREGVSFLPDSLNLLKRTLMMGNSPLGTINNFKCLVDQVANKGDEVIMKKVTGSIQGTIGVFNYLNDAALHVSFVAAGKTLTREMGYADNYIPELKGILAAWKEWEPDYYAEVVSRASGWFTDRTRLIMQRFPNSGTLKNPAIMKFVYDTTLLAAQRDRIKSPLAD
ncbi:uncharacterized protein BCR38DRAFT_411445 [Pseudomassariella vexata]|uniref:Uncharacterized protein n=1 Tax=Pseudomassariella vexata TaxID=1141098 RepID=A0A1Y2DQK8_9PEZI|nr:uncharacterized protein BCR38DRAFT_411445 [Pseudomassariella vexata]ORY61583.1 hypothetical protein BCR38DRAFT_411445 [Pseudomassariella vexata]